MSTVENTSRPLIVYSASAGSGKTFSLVQNYLRLTLNNDAGAMNFSKIIAMTFTNKAAWEMKSRIIQALFQLAYFQPDADKKTSDLMKITAKNMQLSPVVIQKRSKRVLTEILHNYENFNVFTIDKFSLRLIRTFSRDLDLQDNFEVTIDEANLLEQVIDVLLSKIGREGEQEITKLALKYAANNLDDESSWNFRNNLIKFSKILTQETHRHYVQVLLKSEFKQSDFVNITNEIKELEDAHAQKCKTAYDYFISLNTTENDYPYKARGLYGVLDKLLLRKLSNVTPPNTYVQKTLIGENTKPEHNVDYKLIEIVSDLFEFESEILDKYYLLNKQKSSFFNLSLLKYIKNELDAFKEKQNLIGIYEFSQKISELLKKENTSYIYERLGNRYNHYLLDEFQDTSRLQWINLIPLLHESISHNNRNLIVGDAKQAIYRFRNGLVEQFVVLPSIYNPENNKELAQTSRYFNLMGQKETLDKNYRSKKEIVDFNNAFFKHLLTVLPMELGEYYKDLHQDPNNTIGGFVSLELLENDVPKEDIEEKENDFLLQKVKRVINDKYNPGDICILTRNKKEGNRFAQILSQNDYNVVSADSLLISSDKSVLFCIDYLNLRRNQSNKTHQIKFATSYYQQLEKDPIVELSGFWENDIPGNFNFHSFVKKEFENTSRLFFSYENLYDLGTKFFALTGLNELKNPYLHYLLELFQLYDLKFGPDIRGFIDDWELKLKNNAVQIPENKEAVKVMTIHKSKGLEFPIVIIPNLSWRISPNKNDQFIETEDGIILYTKLSKKNVPDYISKQYESEYKQLLLDELNVLYVAFTRPTDRLYALIDTQLPQKSLEFFTQLNYPIVQSLGNFNDEPIVEQTSYYFGEELEKAHQKKQETDNYFIPKDLREFLWFPDLTLQDDAALEEESLSEEQQYGNQLHLVLSKINAENNISQIIEKLALKGKIEQKWKEKIAEDVKQAIALLNEQDFTKTDSEILNEQDLLMGEQIVKRPDKIYVQSKKSTVVDFKTGEPSNKHKKQVQDYCKCLHDLGFDETEGYLLYTKTMRLEKVKNSD